jgi:hypothetical protein
MKMKGKSASLISAIAILLAGLALAGCASTPPLIEAAESGNVKEVEALLNQGADVNMKGGGGLANDSNALDLASLNGHADVVRLLLDRGAKMNAPRGGFNEWSTLSLAAMHLHTDTINILLDRGADINRAIAELNRGIGTGSSVEFLKAIKQERAANQPAVAKLSAVIPAPAVTPKSDVDELPQVRVEPQKNSFAIVIGIEKYRQKLPNADHAVNDAKAMTEYLTKVMGYPEGNVVTLTNENAAKSDFEKYFEKWLSNHVEKDSTVFIYFSGHGAPNIATGDAYLVPYDGDPSFIEQTGYSLKRLYESLNKLPAKEVIVALDSCFSGAGGKSVIAQGARPLVMNLEQDIPVSRNMVVMSASSGDQISSTYEEKGHGLFTYFLLKGMKDGLTEVGELYDYLKPNVRGTARKVFNNEQTPQLLAPAKQKVFLRN